MSLEMRAAGSRRDYVPLAEIKLERTDNAYIIEKVSESGVKHYITSPGQEFLRNSYLEYFTKSVELVNETASPVQSTVRDFAYPSSFQGNEPSFGTETVGSLSFFPEHPARRNNTISNVMILFIPQIPPSAHFASFQDRGSHR